MLHSGKTYATVEAAGYLRGKGVRRSKRTLIRCRLRCPDDPGDHGPDFYRDLSTGECLYFEADLDRYVEQKHAELEFRGRGVAPGRRHQKVA